MFELTFRLDAKSDKPLYEQIYEYIKSEIQNGGLPCQKRLPSTRKLAEHLEVSRSTVTLAYEQLLSEGYVENRPGSGYYVNRLDGLYRLTQEPEPQKEKSIRKEKNCLYDFSPSGVDLGSFPYNSWRKISKKILMEGSQDFYQLGESAGEPELRKTIAEYVHQARGVNCSIDQIVIGAGNDYLLMLLDALLGKDSEPIYAMENPTYRKAYDIFGILGRKVKTISLDEKGIDTALLEKSGANTAYVMPSHHFPLGTVMPMARRLQLLNWAKEKEGRYIIEDDYDSEFRYKGKPIPALQGFDHDGSVIYIGTFSKSIAPAIRISFLILPPSLLERYEKVGKKFSSTVPRMDQKILAEFIKNGYYERHLNRMRALYRARHDAMLEGVRLLPGVLDISGEYAGTHLLVTLSVRQTEEEICSLAMDAGVGVYGLSEYYIGERPKDTALILGYATLDEKKIAAGLQILGQVLSNAKQ